MIKYFISTGCSFTEVPIPEAWDKTCINTDDYPQYSFSWPVHVNNHLKTIPKYKGKGASGNGIISRTTIYEVLNALKNYKSEEILVGVMWSGAYRQEIYSTEKKIDYTPIPMFIEGSNPSSITGEHNFYKVMPYWEDELSKFYYKHMYDDVGAYMQTLEHILRTQWFLKHHNIKYFMTQYYNLTFPSDNKIKNHPDIKYLHDEIDFSNWLDVESEWHWCAQYQDCSTWDDLDNGHFKHPNTPQHKAFADHVIIPHLQKKGYI